MERIDPSLAAQAVLGRQGNTKFIAVLIEAGRGGIDIRAVQRGGVRVELLLTGEAFPGRNIGNLDAVIEQLAGFGLHTAPDEVAVIATIAAKGDVFGGGCDAGRGDGGCIGAAGAQ